jgi:hypothetical protein
MAIDLHIDLHIDLADAWNDYNGHALILTGGST